MHTEADTDYLQSVRTLGAHIARLSKSLAFISAQKVSADFVDELTELLRAQERLKECIDYRPLAPSSDAQRTWTHDFRNHLNAVKGYAELLEEDEACEQFRLRPMLNDVQDLVRSLNLCSTESESAHGGDLTAGIQRPNERTGTILVVEDNEENRRLLVRVLLAQNHVVIEAATAQQAFAQLKNNDVELILLDLILPDMNGFDILQQLKSDASLRSISVIMVSGQHEHDEAIRCIQAGAEDYLFKPVNQVLLGARIDASLERKSWRDREQSYVNELARSHAFIRKTFGRYTSEEIVDRLLEDPHGLEMGGRLQNVSILMSDICRFTTMCDSLQPHEVVQMLNNYLGTLSEVILAHHGTIDEFIGDAILAIFGAPFSAEDDADRATMCAIAMQNAMRDVNLKNTRDGLPEIETAIAINTGAVVAGNIGSERRSKFAIVGQPVNLTARIEEAASAGEILISDSTRNALGAEFRYGSSRIIRAKGFRDLITVHEVLAYGERSLTHELQPKEVAEARSSTSDRHTEIYHA